MTAQTGEKKQSLIYQVCEINQEKKWKKEVTIFYFLHYLYLCIILQGWASAGGVAKDQPTKNAASK